MGATGSTSGSSMDGQICIDSDDEDIVVVATVAKQAPPPAAEVSPPAADGPPKPAEDEAARTGMVASAPESHDEDIVVLTESTKQAPSRSPEQGTDAPMAKPTADSPKVATQVPRPKRTRRPKKRIVGEPLFIDLDGDETANTALRGALSEQKKRPVRERRAGAVAAKPMPKAAAKLGSASTSTTEVTDKAAKDSPPNVEASAIAEMGSGDGDADAELDKKALEMAEKALENLPAEGKEEKILKAKVGILKRLKQQAVEQAALEKKAALEREQLAIVAKERQIAVAMAQKATLEKAALQREKLLRKLQSVAPKSNLKLGNFLKNRLTWARAGSRDDNAAAKEPQENPETSRRLEREKRKALWGRSGEAIEPNADGKLTANSWEKSEFESTGKKDKFLRLMGGQKLVEAAEAVDQNNAALEEDEDDDCICADNDIPTDVPTFELCGGEWKEEVNHEQQKKDLIKQFGQAMRQKHNPHAGIGAV